MAKNQYDQKVILRREDINSAVFMYRDLSLAAKSLDISLDTLLWMLREYRKSDALVNEAPKSKPDKKFKDPFPSRNIHHPDPEDNFGKWKTEIQTVGRVRFPYNPNR